MVPVTPEEKMVLESKMEGLRARVAAIVTEISTLPNVLPDQPYANQIEAFMDRDHFGRDLADLFLDEFGYGGYGCPRCGS